ncbi:MAG: ABC transporter permease [Massilimicrobiota sp.]|nr:ABC transporter permease [Massilimicrobiota sp.]
MKTIHINKLLAIIEVKGKALFSKNFIIMPIFSLGMTYIMKLAYGSISKEIDMTGYYLSMGVLMNVCMTGVYCVAACLAEEKEKNTLRTLMTSSVNGLEFFLGSLIPVVLLMVIVNVLCVFIAGFSMTITEWLCYVAITTISSIIGAVTGMIFGIFAKNQMSAGTMTTPVLILFMLIPMFSHLNEIIETISNYLFTGVIMNFINHVTTKVTLTNPLELGVLFLEFILTVILFLVLYKKNGFEAN